MAQQDKTDWYWNGGLAGAVNNLYYDLINVDVCHVPYTTNHRNSSFFLKTRLPYVPQWSWKSAINTLQHNRDVTDVHIIWDEKCNETSWKLYVLARDTSSWTVRRRLFTANIVDWCVWSFDNVIHHQFAKTVEWCWDWKFLVTDYVKGTTISVADMLNYSSSQTIGWYSWIQVNKVEWWITTWIYRDGDTVAGYAKWKSSAIWKYILIYDTKNGEWDGLSWQVRLVTDVSSDGRDLILDSPWLWLKVPEEGKESVWKHVKAQFFSERWEIIWFTDGTNISLVTDYEHDVLTTIYRHNWTTSANATNIISVASANDKVFILTDNWYIHYSKEWIGHNKFYIDDDMFAWTDKTSITAYRDMIIAFWRKGISLWVPDEQNRFWTMYNQSTSIWLWSRYSYAEYEWDLIFVSNDKRLLALAVQSTWRYWLAFDDVWDRLNWKLAALVEWDEVYVWSDENYLRIFVNTKDNPFIVNGSDIDINNVNNTLTHIYKFNTLFKVWTEDHIPHFLLWWAKYWIYFWQYWLYTRWWETDIETYEDVSGKYPIINTNYHPVETKVNAYLIENESNWEWQNSALANRPKLYQLAKLNRLITTLWPGVYSNTTKIKITTYSKWIGYTYELPISWDWNDWVWLITSYYLNEWLTESEEEKIDCMLSTLQDSQKQYQPNCPDSKVYRQYCRWTQPRCDKYTEMITESHWVCINDKLYELAPTMPLTTDLWENQPYATQIKLELIWWKGDIICFGWWLAELFVAPLFTTWPDWEYQLQPNTDCE